MQESPLGDNTEAAEEKMTSSGDGLSQPTLSTRLDDRDEVEKVVADTNQKKNPETPVENFLKVVGLEVEPSQLQPGDPVILSEDAETLTDKEYKGNHNEWRFGKVEGGNIIVCKVEEIRDGENFEKRPENKDGWRQKVLGKEKNLKIAKTKTVPKESVAVREADMPKGHTPPAEKVQKNKDDVPTPGPPLGDGIPDNSEENATIETDKTLKSMPEGHDTPPQPNDETDPLNGNSREDVEDAMKSKNGETKKSEEEQPLASQEEKAENETEKPDEIFSREEIKNILREALRKGAKTTPQFTDTYKQIWEQARLRGAIEKPDGGWYERSVEEMEEAENIQYWYQYDNQGNPVSNQPVFESRMFNHTVKDFLDTYRAELVDQEAGVGKPKFTEQVKHKIENHKSFLVETGAEKNHAAVWCRGPKIRTDDNGNEIVSFTPVYRKREFKDGEDTFSYSTGEPKTINLAALAALERGSENNLDRDRFNEVFGFESGNVKFLDEDNPFGPVNFPDFNPDIGPVESQAGEGKAENEERENILESEKKSKVAERLADIDTEKLSPAVEDIITGERQRGLITAYWRHKQAYAAAKRGREKPDGVDDGTWHKAKSSLNDLRKELKQEEGRLGYKMHDMANTVFTKANTREDFKTFLAIAPASLNSERKQARTALKDEGYRKSLSKANEIKEKLKQKKRNINERIESSQNTKELQEELNRVDSLLARLDINPQSANQMPDPNEISVGEGGEDDETDAEQEKEQSVSVGEVVVLTEGGKEYEVKSFYSDEYNKETVAKIESEDGSVKLKFKSELQTPADSLEETQPDRENTNEENMGKSTDKSYEKLKERALTREQIRNIIASSKSATAAAEEILSHDTFIWNDRQIMTKQDNGLWRVIRKDSPDLDKTFFDTEMASRVLRSVVKHENYQPGNEKEIRQENIELTKKFVSGATDALTSLYEAAREEGESPSDEAEIRLSLKKLGQFVEAGNRVNKELLQKYRDRFVQTMNYFRNQRPDRWKAAEIKTSDVKQTLQHVDNLMQNLQTVNS